MQLDEVLINLAALAAMLSLIIIALALIMRSGTRLRYIQHIAEAYKLGDIITIDDLAQGLNKSRWSAKLFLLREANIHSRVTPISEGGFKLNGRGTKAYPEIIARRHGYRERRLV
jgi:hypothetical protein